MQQRRCCDTVAHLGPAAVRTGSRGCVSICVALSVVLRGKCQSVLQLLYLQSIFHGKLSPKTQSRSNTMKERQPGSRYLQIRPLHVYSGTVAQIDGGWAERRNGSISTVPRPLGPGVRQPILCLGDVALGATERLMARAGASVPCQPMSPDAI